MAGTPEMSNQANQDNDYFRCGGCGRFVLYSNMQKHYEGDKETNSKPHEYGIAVETPPAPATVANPAPPPQFYGRTIPPMRQEPQTQGGIFDKTFQRTTNVILMYRSFPRAFKLWTVIVVGVTAWLVSSLYTLIVFHI